MPAQPENLNAFLNAWDAEKVPVIVKEEPPKIDKEIETLVQKIETDYLSKPITDAGGQPLVSPPAPQAPTITLPVTKGTFATGLTKKVSNSVRWLAEWCLRLVKIFGARAVFREEKV